MAAAAAARSCPTLLPRPFVAPCRRLDIAADLTSPQPTCMLAAAGVSATVDALSAGAHTLAGTCLAPACSLPSQSPSVICPDLDPDLDVESLCRHRVF